MSDEQNTLSRRNMLTRIGTLAAVAYTAPAFTTMSMAHASDGGSAASSNSSASSPSEPSEASEASAPSSAESCADAGGTWDAATGTCLLA